MNLFKKKNRKIKVEIYSKDDCHLCDEAKAVLLKVRDEFPFEFSDKDITRDEKIFAEFKEQIPIVFINGRKAFKFRVDEGDLRRKLKRLQ